MSPYPSAVSHFHQFRLVEQVERIYFVKNLAVRKPKPLEDGDSLESTCHQSAPLSNLDMTMPCDILAYGPHKHVCLDTLDKMFLAA
jgi:hypothetical protein